MVDAPGKLKRGSQKMFPTTVCNQTYTTVPLRVIPVASERRTVLRKQSFTIIDVPVGGDNSKAVAVRIDRPNKLALH
jgi:hypothetical protein